MKNLKKIAASVAIAAGIAGTAAACSSSPSAPPTATSVLQSNGYTVLENLSPSQIQSTFGSAAPDISSAAAGSNSGGNLEVALVLNSQGQAEVQAAQSQLQSEIASSPGLSLSVNGAVLTVSGSESAFANSNLGQ